MKDTAQEIQARLDYILKLLDKNPYLKKKVGDDLIKVYEELEEIGG